MIKLKKIGAIALATILSTMSIVGCSSKEEAKKEISFLNYGENIADGLLKEFEEQNNIKVNMKTFDDMETMYIEATSGKTNWDVILAADYMVERLISENKLEMINKDNVPNLAQMDSDFMGLPFDVNNDYSVPYMSGTIGIIYNEDLVDAPVDSWESMWDEKYKGEIFVLDAQRDAIGMALKKLGYSINSTDPKELEEAKNELIKQKPLVLKYGADEVKDLMISGDASVAMIWSGEGLTLQDEYPNLKYVVPKEGANFWIDNLCIPKGTANKDDAEKFINFLSSKDSAFRNAEEIGYTTPNAEAKKEQAESVQNNPGAYMPDEIMDKCEGYNYQTEDVRKLYGDLWGEIKSK